MKLRRSAEKLDDYRKRLEKGKVAKIKPAHVEHIINKLNAKRTKVARALEGADNKKKRERFTRKLAVVDEQLERAQWLENEVSEKTKTNE